MALMRRNLMVRFRHMDTKRIFRSRFLEKRVRIAGTQKEFSDYVKAQTGIYISPSHISGIEQGRRTVSFDRLVLLASALETNPNWLLGVTDDDTPPSDMEDQVVFTVQRNPHTRRDALQRICQMIEALPDNDFEVIAATVERFAALRKQAQPPRQRRMRPEDEQDFQKLKDTLVDFVNAVAGWGGGEFRDELATEIATVAMDADGFDVADVEILRHYAQQAVERLQRSGRGAVECGA